MYSFSIGKFVYKFISRLQACLFLFVTTFCAYSQVVKISEDTQQQRFYSHILYVEDAENSLNIDDVVNLPLNTWQVSDNTTPDFGFTDSAYWFSFDIQNTSSTTKEFVLNYDYAAMDYISVYFFDNTNNLLLKQYHTGDQNLFSSRPIQHSTFAFPFLLNQNDTLKVYVKINSKGSVIMPVSVSSKDQFYQNQILVYMLYTLILALLFLTTIHNFSVYWKTGERVFLAFACFTFLMALVGSSLSGFAYQYFWPSNLVWNSHLTILLAGAAALSHLVFTQIFLSPPKSFKVVFKLFYILNALLVLAYPFVDYNIAVRLVLSVGMAIAFVTYLMAIYMWIKGSKVARVYSFAWGIYIIGMFMSASIRFGLVPFTWFTEFLGSIGVVITTIVLSLALGDRLRSEKKSRLVAQHRAIDSLEKYQALFENAVEGIFFVDQKHRFTAVNPSFLKMFGYSSFAELKDNNDKIITALFSEGRAFEKLNKNADRSKHNINLKAQTQELDLSKINGNSFWVFLSVRIVSDKNEANTHHFEGSIVDITEQKLTEQKLSYLASHDPLTKTFNRREFEARLSKIIRKPSNTVSTCVLYMDLDQFKVVNDTCGHGAGDILLRELSQLMLTKLGKRGTLARLGGDEFGVLLCDMNSSDYYKIASELLLLVRNYRFNYEHRVFNLGISIGLVELKDDRMSVDNIMSLADTACYVAKDTGRNKIYVHSPDNEELLKRRSEMELVVYINHALERNLFELHRQAIVESDEGHKVVGYEILLRMLGKDGDLISPGAFLPAAERYDLMGRIDKWVIKHTFKHLSVKRFLLDEVEHYAINLSAQSMADEKFVDFLSQSFEEYSIPYTKICFEITETVAIYNLSLLLELMNKLQGLGCQFSLDDFGSGFSSYAYLKNLPVNNLKIDGSFIIDILQDPVDHLMVKSIDEVAKTLGMKTIAEFVQSDDIAQKLQQIGVSYLQGYGIAKPEKMP